MPTWIRFRYDNGDTTLVNADETHILFKVDENRIEVLPARPEPGSTGAPVPLCTYGCEYPDQVSAAEDLIFDALGKQQSVTISLDILEEHAEYLNNVQGIRMVLSLIHQGSIRIPRNEEITDDGELFDSDEDRHQSEISRFESMLHTYLEVPPDSLRRAYRRTFQDIKEDSPFGIKTDHEECPDHGFHEYWIVETRSDCNYAFREGYNDLVQTLEKEGYNWGEGHPLIHHA
ncbi:MAG: hypothetical protein OEZ59_12170 [Deltaproteobacteria bacterium]|nr:hypothetical protein [Deltaproteobacteria bacterium]